MRDTLAFMLAGTVFGLVVGYMAAQWGVLPSPAPVAAAARVSGPATAPASSRRLDPNEVAALEALAARRTQDPAARVELGNLYMDAGRWDDAIRWYREALALDASLVDVATDLGVCLLSAGRPEQALGELQKALAGDQGHRLALYNRVLALLQLGRAKDAAEAWQELQKRHPDDPRLQRLRERIDETRAAAEAGR